MTAEPEIYMTPQLAKRKDGLCPSLLNDEVLQVPTPKGGPSYAAISKSYQTNTKYLKESIRELENEAEELKFISDSVNSFLTEYVNGSHDIANMEFEPKGCTWKVELSEEKLRAPDYRIQVVCMAKDFGNKRTTFVVDTISSTSLPGFKEAKATFEALSLVVRKAVVRCEFPEFPEGCKGRVFREVYQLNARVCS
jgi:S-methylmethionine-dependent homocysteine/selenocysteine methylase